MDNSYLLICIAIMAGVTYLVRMLPLALIKRRITNRFVLSFLYYVPYAVLSAMAFPAVFTCTGSLLAGICGLVCCIVCVFWKNNCTLIACAGVVGAMIPTVLEMVLNSGL